MAPALVEAWGSSSPVLAVTTNIAVDQIGRGTGTLHELKDQDHIFKSITKQRFCLRTPNDVPATVPPAIATACSGRPGPVYLEVPADLWDRKVSEAHEELAAPDPVSDCAPWPGDLEQAVQLLGEAAYPAILAGTGAVRAGLAEEIRSLAEALQAPVFTNAEGKGLLPEDHELSCGNAARRGVVREMLQSATIVLALGTRLRAADYQRRGVSLPRLIHVDSDDIWINRNYPAELRLSGDVRAIARRLRERIRDQAPRAGKGSWPLAVLQENRSKERAAAFRDGPEIEYLDTLRRVIPREGSLVADNTMLGYWAEYFYPSFRPGGLITAKGSSIIGFSFPAALGLKIACPERPVVALIGDGGFLYCSQELATCRRHGLGFPVVVVNDGAYGMIDLLQRQIYGRGDFQTDLVNPDLPALAAAYGVAAERVKTPRGLEQALGEALASREMRIIELRASFGNNPFVRY
jgi:acetolactate synthase-1/2/3 large subunit